MGDQPVVIPSSARAPRMEGPCGPRGPYLGSFGAGLSPRVVPATVQPCRARRVTSPAGCLDSRSRLAIKSRRQKAAGITVGRTLRQARLRPVDLPRERPPGEASTAGGRRRRGCRPLPRPGHRWPHGGGGTGGVRGRSGVAPLPAGDAVGAAERTDGGRPTPADGGAGSGWSGPGRGGWLTRARSRAACVGIGSRFTVQTSRTPTGCFTVGFHVERLRIGGGGARRQRRNQTDLPIPALSPGILSRELFHRMVARGTRCLRRGGWPARWALPVLDPRPCRQTRWPRTGGCCWCQPDRPRSSGAGDQASQRSTATPAEVCCNPGEKA